MSAHRLLRYLLAAALPLLASATHAQTAINWNTPGMQFRASGGEAVNVICPPRGSLGPLWGTDTYTDDSSVCTAGVHAGLITQTQGGTLTLRARPGMARYVGSTRNGVISRAYEEWEGSFTLSRGRAPTPDPIVRALHRSEEPPPVEKPTGPEHLVIPWDRTAARLAPNGKRFTFDCLPHGKPSVLKGGEVYSWDSSICTAAVHAGAITVARGGVVTIEMTPGAVTYAGSARNGVTSTDGARTTLGFIIIKPDKR